MKANVVRSLVDIWDDPIGAKEEVTAGILDRLEDCGFTVRRSGPTKTVSSRRLDYVALAIQASEEES